MKNKIATFLYHFSHFVKNIIEKYKTIDLSFSKKHIVIFIGDKKFDISVFKQDKLIDYILIDKDVASANEDINFLAKFPGYKVFFVLDSPDIEIHHSDIPVSQGIIYQNPLTKFIATKFDKNILVASNVYNITRGDQEIYNSIFAATKVSDILYKLIDYTSFNGFDVNGVYFFSLNAPVMVENIVKTLSLGKAKHPLYIFITVTSVSKIRVLILANDNVMHSETIDYPEDKSEAYIQGIIEQAVTDSLISLKNHMHHKKVEPILMILVNDSLKNLLLDSKFAVDKTIILSEQDFKIKSPKKHLKTELTNHIISYFLNKKTHYHASNEIIGEYLRLKGLNKFLSVPWYILISTLFFILISIEIKNLIEENHANDINTKFYSLSQNYRTSRSNYPDIDNLEDVVSLYYAEQELDVTQKLPFDTIKMLLSSISSNFTLNTLYWEYYDQKAYLISKVRYQIHRSSDVEDGIAKLNSDIEALKLKMPDKNISFSYERNEILNSNNVVTIHVTLRITW